MQGQYLLPDQIIDDATECQRNSYKLTAFWLKGNYVFYKQMHTHIKAIYFLLLDSPGNILFSFHSLQISGFFFQERL